MRKSMLFVLCLIGFCGCQTSPGFRMGWEFTIPPTINSTSALHPLPTAPTTTYALEAAPQVPIMQRSIQTTPHPVQVMPQAQPMPRQVEALPMPVETNRAIRQPTSPCQPIYE